MARSWSSTTQASRIHSEWHLRKFFAKLSIDSRRQLRDALPRGDAEATHG
jgi:hypothetical protein